MGAQIETLGQHLRRLRKRAGMTLIEAAERVETDAGSLSRIERDQRDPTLRQLRDLAALYGVSAASLLAGPTKGRRSAPRRAAARFVRSAPGDLSGQPPDRS